MKNRFGHLITIVLMILCLLWGSPLWANAGQSMVTFRTLKETLTQLLPQSRNFTRRDITLNKGQVKHLKRNRNWDTFTREYVLYHSKNAENKITRTVVLFPQWTRQGNLLVAVGLDNHGVVTGTVLMEAQRPTVNSLMPVLRSDLLDSFTGKDKSMKLKLPKSLKKKSLAPISKLYALRITNAVKKSAQLFEIIFQRGAKEKNRD